LVNALDVQQLKNLLTGNMSDQQVTVANRIQSTLTGGTAASGYVGGNVTGAPGSGAHLAGDYAIDQGGTVWICTASGTPGTWQRVGDYLLGLANTWALSQTFTNTIVANGGISTTGITATQDVDGRTFEATGAASLGSAQSSRFVGSWTTVGAPTGLTAEVADYGLDGNTNVWVCTAAGTPGTWRAAGPHLLDVKSGAVATYDFNEPISGAYRELEFRFFIRDTSATVGISAQSVTFNNDSGGNYYAEAQTFSGTTTVAPNQGLAQTSWAWFIVGGGSPANFHSGGVIRIHGYAGGGLKVAEAQFLTPVALTTGNLSLIVHSCLYNSTTAITRVTFTPATGFDANSYIEMWGLP
jgi:hypothetical protein